jgi:RHS repeat-associated protein
MGSFTYDGAGTLSRAVVQGHDFRFLYTTSDERVAAYEIAPALWTFMGRGFDDKLLNVWTMNGTNFQWKEDEIWRDATLLARTTPATTQHYAVDHLGSPRLITNSTDFTASTQSFAPFGAGGATNSGALQFTGQERDAANLGAGSVALPDYFHARYYDTDRGRFLSVDPIIDMKANLKNPQGWNRYAYVMNNPVRFTDPTGRYVCSGDADVCKTIEGGLQKMRESEAAMKQNDPKRAELHKVIMAYGKAGDATTKIKTVWVNPRDERGNPLLPSNVMGQAGRGGLVAVSLMNIAAKAGGDSNGAFLILGGTLTHEGDHELQPAVVSLPMGKSPSLLSLLFYETNAYTLEGAYYRGLGYGGMAPDPKQGAWGSATEACRQVGCTP